MVVVVVVVVVVFTNTPAANKTSTRRTPLATTIAAVRMTILRGVQNILVTMRNGILLRRLNIYILFARYFHYILH